MSPERPVRHPVSASLVLAASVAAGVVSLQVQTRPEIHCKHFFFGYPDGAPASSDLIIRDVYALSSNDGTKFAD